MDKNMLRGAWLQAKELDDGIKATTEGLRELLENDTTGIIQNFLKINEAYQTGSSRLLYYLEKAGVHEINRKKEP